MNIRTIGISFTLLSVLFISSTSSAFISKCYWRYQLAGVSLAQQKSGFLLDELHRQAAELRALITVKNTAEFSRLCTEQNRTHLALSFNADNCFDLMFNNPNANVTQELAQLINRFNQCINTITPANLQTVRSQEIQLINNAYDALIGFVMRNRLNRLQRGLSPASCIRELQQQAISENKPITSLLRHELFLPTAVVTAIICYQLIWHTFFYQSPEKRKAAERTRRAAQDTDKENNTCSICSDEKTEEELELLSCNHKFCTTCLRGIIDLAFKEQNSTTLRCPNPDCKQPFTTQDIEYIMMYNDQALRTLNQIKEKERIARNPNGRNCPTRDCKFMFIHNEHQNQIIQCPDCSRQFCTNCLNNHPQGVNCQSVREAQDKESTAWRAQHTKPCPQCKAPIEKDGGCERMPCSNCKYEFCWDCNANWKGRHTRTCRYNANRSGYR